MKVSIDGILVSAGKMQNQKQVEEKNDNARRKELSADSVTISNRLNTRLDAIDGEIRDIQTSLTRSQTIREGLTQLQGDLATGGKNQQAILKDVVYDGQPVLRSYVGENPTAAYLQTRIDDNGRAIGEDVNRLKRLQVEVDNIMASELAGPQKVESVIKSIDRLSNLDQVSSLRADSVMRLIK